MNSKDDTQEGTEDRVLVEDHPATLYVKTLPRSGVDRYGYVVSVVHYTVSWDEFGTPLLKDGMTEVEVTVKMKSDTRTVK